jgi:class 3 adenylate cyclase/tetratricopeptide (TPR) repeat protein
VKTCPTCAADNPDGARFCASCGSSLAEACPSCGAERPADARFCPSCGTAFGEPAPAGQERRVVTVLFADVTGSTGLGERLDPERLQEVLGTYFQAMREEIEAEGGTVEKFIGDAVMAAFGVPVAHEDDPARALRAALRMRDRLGAVNDDLEPRFGVRLGMRVGVNTGEVLAAISPQPGDPMVTGDAVNVAARLEQVADPGEILVAERTARAARGFRFRELGRRQLRGKGRPVAAVALDGAAPARAERGVPGLRAPMVGRDQELTLLQTLYRRSASERRPNLVTIYGEPGVGKSRLVREFLSWVESEDPGPYVAFGRCLPYGEGITYWPLAEILKRHAGVLDSDPTDVVLRKIETSCDEVCRADPSIDVANTCRAVAYTAGLEFADAPMRDREPRQIRADMRNAWRSFFSALAAAGPVVVVIEDIHWADEAMLDLLRDVADRVIGPVLILCPARPELLDKDPRWGGGRRNVSSIALDPLHAEDADRLVRLLLSVDDLPDAVRRRILERAEGNPFFLEEIVRHLIDDGRLVRTGDRWRAAADIDDVEIPDTIQAVLAARIDILSPEEKRALQRAAVVGRVFWPGPLQRLLNGDGDRIRETLDRLQERELVLPRLGTSFAEEPEFAFKHVLTREVAYESLPRRDRGRAHAAVAEWIEATAGGRRAEFAELLAHHYEQAHRGERETGRDPTTVEALRARAFETLLAAGTAAAGRFAIERALRMADRAMSLASTPLERARVLELRGATALADYRGDLSWESYVEAVELRLQHAPDDHLAIAEACARAVETPARWPGSMWHPPPEAEVRRYLDLGIAHAPKGSTALVRLLTARAFGPFAFAGERGTSEEEVDEAVRAGLDAAERAHAMGRPDLASAALDGASSAPVVVGRYGRAVPIIERRLALLDRVDDPVERGDVYAMAAWAWTAIGDYPRAIHYADLGAELRHQDVGGVAVHALAWDSLAEFQSGNWRRITDELMPIVLALLGDRADDPPYFTQSGFGSAAFVADARGDGEAERYVAALKRMSESDATTRAHGQVRSWLAWLLLRRGRIPEAQAHLETVRASRTGGHRFLTWQVELELLAATNRWGDAPAVLDRVRAYAAAAGVRALPVLADRLEGRAASVEGSTDRAIDALGRASARLEELGMRWERARADLWLADALLADGRRDAARDRLERATAAFGELGSLLELDQARRIADRIG